MRKALLAAALSFFLANLASAQAPNLSGGKLFRSEEGYLRHNELQCYSVNRLQNARVSGYDLLIEWRKETPKSFLPASINDEWCRCTAASVNTRITPSWTHGRFEIMANMPQGRGTWPVGWSFDHPMYRITNIACAGPDEPAPDDSALPHFMTVVRHPERVRR